MPQAQGRRAQRLGGDLARKSPQVSDAEDPARSSPTAQAGELALSRSLALEEAKNGITVNVVNPSSIDEKELTREEARRIRDARFPIGRPPTVEDVAAAVAFFASEEAEYVTGQVVNVSGGWML